jgi:hypothetical protein
MKMGAPRVAEDVPEITGDRLSPQRKAERLSALSPTSSRKREKSVVDRGVHDIQDRVDAEGAVKDFGRSSGSRRSGGGHPAGRVEPFHVTTRVVADKFTVKVSPLGAYTKYSAPVATLSARQKPVEDKLPCGVIFNKFRLLLANDCKYPMLALELVQKSRSDQSDQAM